MQKPHKKYGLAEFNASLTVVAAVALGPSKDSFIISDFSGFGNYLPIY